MDLFSVVNNGPLIMDRLTTADGYGSVPHFDVMKRARGATRSLLKRPESFSKRGSSMLNDRLLNITSCCFLIIASVLVFTKYAVGAQPGPGSRDVDIGGYFAMKTDPQCRSL